MRNKSGIFVAPERWMSSCVMTKIAAAACDIFCSFLETDVTSIFIRSSSDICDRSRCAAACRGGCGASCGAGRGECCGGEWCGTECGNCPDGAKAMNQRNKTPSPASRPDKARTAVTPARIDTWPSRLLREQVRAQ